MIQLQDLVVMASSKWYPLTSLWITKECLFGWVTAVATKQIEKMKNGNVCRPVTPEHYYTTFQIHLSIVFQLN